MLKIKNPKTKRLITVNGQAYKNLIKNDYYLETDLKLLITTPNLIISSYILENDQLLYTIMLYLNIDELNYLCMTNKFANNIYVNLINL